jgi:cell division protein FtsB
MKRSHSNQFHLSQRYLSESELRVIRQEQAIEKLKRQGRSTEQAEKVLEEFKKTLHSLRNHLQIMEELMRPDEPSKHR